MVDRDRGRHRNRERERQREERADQYILMQGCSELKHLDKLTMKYIQKVTVSFGIERC